MIKALLVYAAAVPLAAGSALPETQVPSNATITARLCSGGSIEIDLGLPRDEHQDAPCELEACHAGTCRKRIDLRQ